MGLEERNLGLEGQGGSNLANDATTPGQRITTDATHSEFFRYRTGGGPFWTKSRFAYSGETPVIYVLRVATMTWRSNCQGLSSGPRVRKNN